MFTKCTRKCFNFKFCKYLLSDVNLIYINVIELTTLIIFAVSIFWYNFRNFKSQFKIITFTLTNVFKYIIIVFHYVKNWLFKMLQL